MHWVSLPFLAPPLLFLASHVSAVDSTSSQILTPEIDAAINNILFEWNTPGGAAVVVVRMDGNGGWLTETKGYGTANSDGTKVNADTIFSLGSDSKANPPQLARPLFNVLATGLLISNTSLIPQISWKTKIASILPTWKLMDPVASAGSTITDLMSHRTGLPRHDVMYNPNEDTPSLIKRLQYLKPSTGFREDLQYNNLMYIVLSYLPTALIPGRPPFARYVKQHIFDPLGMKSTTYSFAEANETGRMADGFVRFNINYTDNPEDGNLLSGPGGVLSTATDMAQWLKMLLLNGQHPETNATVIPGDVIQKVADGVSIWVGTPSEPELSPSVYGAGQIQSSYRGHVMIEASKHTAETSQVPISPVCFHSQVTRLPFDGLGIAVLTNDNEYGSFYLESIKFRIIDAVMGLEPIDWSARYQARVTAFTRQRLDATPTPPGAPLPPPTIASLARKYRNSGYGPDIELCVVGDAPKSASAHCSALISHVNATFPASLTGAALLWEWDRFVATYARLTHFKGAMFNVSGWIAVPTTNTSFAGYFPYDSGLGDNTVEFVFGGGAHGEVEGFGIKGGFWGATVDEEPVGVGVKGSAEVWFDAI
ncbi:beta-lactamase/transpeptidase-like protein [Mycena rebaudengoi]|nr:beta-lactamase/transpeptidase-like protein [Mycena rebaudengoi]